MSIKEQIRAEIDKLYGEYKDKFHQSGDQYHLGLIDGLDMAERVLDTLPEQPVDGLEEKDFVEEVRQYYSNNCTWDALKQPMLSIITRCARHFAEWQKAKMMEEAVEGYVGVHLTKEGSKVTVNSGYLPKEMGIKNGDKVRIIVIKEDEK